MKKLSHFTVAGFILTMGSALPSRAETYTVSAPEVPRSIKAGKPYRSTLIIKKPTGTKITKVSYYWNWEGPFRQSFRLRGNKLSSRLITRNPGTYGLHAKVCFKLASAPVKCVRGPEQTIVVK